MTICLASSLLCNSRAWAGFDWSGFKSGMSPAAVDAQLDRMGFQVRNRDVTDTGFSIVATSQATGHFVSLSFCRDKLYLAQFDIESSFPNFVRTVQKYEREYGPASLVHPDSDVSAAGEKDSLSVWWKRPFGWFTVEYIKFPSNDQLSLIFEDKSVCR
jgi:hypothetical protein